MSSATPQGSVSCIMCKGAVSVRAGNLEKMKVHVESDHDVFFDHDILIAINFLESHEKEVIIEKVLPRMKMLFQNMLIWNICSYYTYFLWLKDLCCLWPL